MRLMPFRVAIVLVILMNLGFSSGLCAQTPPTETKQCVIGHFTLSIPKSWNQFTGADKTAARNEFSSDLTPGLKQYNRQGAPPPKMGEFEIFQKPTDGQLIGWTLVIPPQTDFLKEILKKEDLDFQKQKNMAGGKVKAGSCRLVRVGSVDLVRVDVEMANGGKSTNLHFWSPKSPGIITTLMLGLRPNKSERTEKEFESIISSITVNEEVK